MKMVDKRLYGAKAFSELQIGECFTDEAEVFMKIVDVDATNKMKLNCVCLTTGMTYSQDEHTMVIPVDTELHIYTKR